MTEIHAARFVPLPQRGSVVLIVILMIAAASLLGIGTHRSVDTDLAVVSALQYRQHAFNAAENLIAETLAKPATLWQKQTKLSVATRLVAPAIKASAEVQWLNDTRPPASALQKFSTTRHGIVARHFEITATALAPRGARAVHRQGFFVLTPAISARQLRLLSQQHTVLAATQTQTAPGNARQGIRCRSVAEIQTHACASAACTGFQLCIAPQKTIWRNDRGP